MIKLKERLGFLEKNTEKKHLSDRYQNKSMKVLNLSVVNHETEKPIANALISIESIGKTAVCNADGNVCIEEITPGKYDVDVISPGFVAQRVSVLISNEEPAEYKVLMVSNR